jgi:hypothetical protein
LKVVFPAPFGPRIACRMPSRTFRLSLQGPSPPYLLPTPILADGVDRSSGSLPICGRSRRRCRRMAGSVPANARSLAVCAGRIIPRVNRLIQEYRWVICQNCDVG